MMLKDVNCNSSIIYSHHRWRPREQLQHKTANQCWALSVHALQLYNTKSVFAKDYICSQGFV